MWVVYGIGIVLVVVALYMLTTWLAPRKCPDCRVTMRLLTTGCGKTKKYECPKCRHRVDTGIPIGRGRR